MITSILLTVVTIAFGFYIYKNPPSKTHSTNSPSNSICMDYSNEPINKLRVDLIHKMVNGYKDKQLGYIKNGINGVDGINDDAHSIWFELETLKKFIYHIERNSTAKDKNISSKNLGIRLYYSKYPEGENWNRTHSDLVDLPYNYEKRHTLVMVPTIEKKGIHCDFNPIDVDTYLKGLSENPNYAATNTTTSIPALTVGRNSRSNSSNTGSQNHGGLIPPADGSGENF